MGEVEGNRELLRRAVENVLRNAIRYSPEHSTIEVFIAEDSRAAVVSIRDFGPGIPEDAIAKIFDPFFRLDEARDAMSGGSGLGLIDCKARGAGSSRHDRRRECIAGSAREDIDSAS